MTETQIHARPAVLEFIRALGFNPDEVAGFRCDVYKVEVELYRTNGEGRRYLEAQTAPGVWEEAQKEHLMERPDRPALETRVAMTTAVVPLGDFA